MANSQYFLLQKKRKVLPLYKNLIMTLLSTVHYFDVYFLSQGKPKKDMKILQIFSKVTSANF